MLDGFAAGERDTGVVVRVEPDVIRDFGVELAEEVLQVALKYAGLGVVSLNCAGSERQPIAPYADIFRRAVESGLHSTPHAGEWSGPENVVDTLEHLRPERMTATAIVVESGVVVTLNSDDPAMFGSWVSDEYRVARDVFGYDDEELADIAGASVRSSFADDDVKDLILRDIEAWLASG